MFDLDFELEAMATLTKVLILQLDAKAGDMPDLLKAKAAVIKSDKMIVASVVVDHMTVAIDKDGNVTDAIKLPEVVGDPIAIAVSKDDGLTKDLPMTIAIDKGMADFDFDLIFKLNLDLQKLLGDNKFYTKFEGGKFGDAAVEIGVSALGVVSAVTTRVVGVTATSVACCQCCRPELEFLD